jgi:NAD(P)-dependent dehydrogenase (short-subunit alcohol dehydrogenase family)/acyl dehydratase/acyl carrier protein
MDKPEDMTPADRFSRFETGDHIVFTRTFTAADFAAFSELSGDSNAYHHDREYAKAHGDTETIVPLHVTLAPLSAIAGMNFPGEPSIYLGHEARALHPVRYGEEVTYSARIAAMNESHAVLTLEVLCMVGDKPVAEANMRVQARYRGWQAKSQHPIRKMFDRTALVTGASGEIGSAIALELAREGWSLLLQDRGPSDRREKLAAALDESGAEVRFVAADLGEEDGITRLAEAVGEAQDLALIVHCASPPVMSPVEAHVDVAYNALAAAYRAALPAMLRRQDGKAILIGSSATETGLDGWEAYAGAKAMATQYLRMANQRHARFGVTGHTLAPGMVGTEFSQSFRGEDDDVLLPYEVAREVVSLAEGPRGVPKDVILTAQNRREGAYGFAGQREREDTPMSRDAAASHAASNAEPATRDVAGLGQLVRRQLGLAPSIPLEGAGLGTTPGWDSLAHIELILAVEQAYGLHLTSKQIDATQTFGELQQLVAGGE